MNIHVVGGGALGLFFAAELSAKHSVTLQTKTAKQKQEIQKKGILVKENGENAVYFVQTVEKVPPNADLIIIAVKQYQLANVLADLPEKPSLLFLQNGFSHLKQMETAVNQEVYAAAVEHGCAKLNARTVQVNGRNQTKVSAVKNGKEIIAGLLQTSRFAFSWCEDAKKMLIEKMAANAVINPLTALLEVPNGELEKSPSCRSAVLSLCTEFVRVFPSQQKEETIEKVFTICRKTADNESSMLKDVKAGRPTELDAIVGALLSEAKRKNVEAPSFELLYHLVKEKSGEATAES